MTNIQPTIVTTGATSGLGLELAKHYHGQSARLILIGRRPIVELDPRLFTPERYCHVDLCEPDAADIVERFLRDQGIEHVDVLIHNAGVGYFGPLELQGPANLSRLVGTNLRAPISLTHRLLPYILRRRGRIVFVSSLVAGLPAPRYAVYAATKAGLEAFARNLRVELGTSVRIQTIAPGAIRTALHEKSGVPPHAIKWATFPTAAVVAAQVIRAIERGSTDTAVGLGNRIIRFGARWWPALVDRLVAARRR